MYVVAEKYLREKKNWYCWNFCCLFFPCFGFEIPLNTTLLKYEVRAYCALVVLCYDNILMLMTCLLNIFIKKNSYILVNKPNTHHTSIKSGNFLLRNLIQLKSSGFYI